MLQQHLSNATVVNPSAPASDAHKVCEKVFLQLTGGLTCTEIARLTPGYEVGDLIRLLEHLRAAALLRQDKEELDNIALGLTVEATSSREFSVRVLQI
ncbi:unnamed protein product [Protopolystoma xenopodis]|uniref:Uncharacterized protein n=1 Tax=Protopolystoma xenopodis TaxID=117903 RepID=A0A448XQQ5_9PLAT|nr:unnamed protein product [Protopolystoma xenopodis]